MQLAEAFKELRQSRGASFRWIGGKCDLCETTPWKIEHGKGVRWETLHLILTKALKAQPGSRDYENIHRLWIADRADRAESQAPEKGRKQAPNHEVNAIAKFRDLIRGRPKGEVAKILAAARRSAGQLERNKGG